MAKLADAQDLKSCGGEPPYGFDSRPGQSSNCEIRSAKFEFCRLGYNRFMTVRQILEEAKRLEPIERAELLEQLYATFEPADPSVDAAWSVEVEERLSAYRAGEIEAAPFEDVLDRINTGNRG